MVIDPEIKNEGEGQQQIAALVEGKVTISHTSTMSYTSACVSSLPYSPARGAHVNSPPVQVKKMLASLYPECVLFA